MWKNYSYAFSLCSPDFPHCKDQAQITYLSGTSPGRQVTEQLRSSQRKGNALQLQNRYNKALLLSGACATPGSREPCALLTEGFLCPSPLTLQCERQCRKAGGREWASAVRPRLLSVTKDSRKILPRQRKDQEILKIILRFLRYMKLQNTCLYFQSEK